MKNSKSVSEIKVKNIGRTQALELIKNNKGKFFTAVYITKKDKLRTINCQYLKDQGVSELGYVKVVENVKLKNKEQGIRNLNLQTLQLLKIGGKVFNVGK